MHVDTLTVQSRSALMLRQVFVLVFGAMDVVAEKSQGLSLLTLLRLSLLPEDVTDHKGGGRAGQLVQA